MVARLPAFHPARFLRGGALAAGLLLAAACSTPPLASPDIAPVVTGTPPAAAWYREGRLLLRYGSVTQAVWLAAGWAPDDAATLLEPLPESPADAPPEGWEPVTLHEREGWRQVIGPVLAGFAPDKAGSATLVAAPGRDFLVRRNADGSIDVVDSPGRQTEVAIVREIGEDAFAAALVRHLRDTHASSDEPPGPLLFAAAEDALGNTFLLFDLRRDRALLVTQGASTLPIDRRIGYSLRMADALLLRSHVLSVLRNPLSGTSRLVGLTAQSGAMLLPRGLPGAPETPPPPLAWRPGMDIDAWEADLDARLNATPLPGRMEPLIDGEAYFNALVAAIREARTSIDIQVYIFDSDDYALKIADLLKQRSREVRVRVLVDRLGSLVAGQVPARSPYRTQAHPPLAITDYLKHDSAIAVRALDNPWLTSDHAKLIVVDGQRAWLGGMNIGREYRYEWHDLMVAVSGPVVSRLQADFDQRWAYAGLGGDAAWALAAARPEQTATAPAMPDAFAIRTLYTRPIDPQILRAQLAAIRAAQARIWIQQPYVSDDEVIAALVEARRRGVDVRVILPTRNDSGFMHSANLLAANTFLRNGIRVYGYPGMTHVKAALYDGWACIGSANFDKLSLRVNREIDLATSDPGFVGRLERELFLADFARSREWTEARPVRWTDYLGEFLADQL